MMKVLLVLAGLTLWLSAGFAVMALGVWWGAFKQRWEPKNDLGMCMMCVIAWPFFIVISLMLITANAFAKVTERTVEHVEAKRAEYIHRQHQLAAEAASLKAEQEKAESEVESILKETPRPPITYTGSVFDGLGRGLL